MSKTKIGSLRRQGRRWDHRTIRRTKRSFNMRNETQDEDAISLEDDTAFAERIHRQERRSRKNIGILEGRISVGVGGGLLLLGALSRKRLGLGLGLASAGGYLLYRALTRRDPIYRLFGWNTETQGDQG